MRSNHTHTDCTIHDALYWANFLKLSSIPSGIIAVLIDTLICLTR
jgi:hypothetical protein